MKTTKDRMGSFISAEIINVKDVASFQVRNNRATVSLKNGIERNMLDIVKNGVDPNVSSTTQKSGELFNIEIRIELKTHDFIKYMSFNKYLSILETPTGEKYLYGTPNFPLTLKQEPLQGKNPSTRSGSLITLTGKQPNNVLII